MPVKDFAEKFERYCKELGGTFKEDVNECIIIGSDNETLRITTTNNGVHIRKNGFSILLDLVKDVKFDRNPNTMSFELNGGEVSVVVYESLGKRKAEVMFEVTSIDQKIAEQYPFWKKTKIEGYYA